MATPEITPVESGISPESVLQQKMAESPFSQEIIDIIHTPAFIDQVLSVRKAYFMSYYLSFMEGYQDSIQNAEYMKGQYAEAWKKTKQYLAGNPPDEKRQERLLAACKKKDERTKLIASFEEEKQRYQAREAKAIELLAPCQEQDLARLNEIKEAVLALKQRQSTPVPRGPDFDPLNVFISYPQMRTHTRAFDEARTAYLAELRKEDKKPDTEAIARARDAYEAAQADLLLAAVVAKRKEHGVQARSLERNDAYERDLDTLFAAFFIRGDQVVLREVVDGTQSVLMRHPDLILAFGERATSRTHGTAEVLFATINRDPIASIESSSDEFDRIRGEFDSARAGYLTAYHVHLDRMKSMQTRQMIGRAGLHRGNIGALKDQHAEYRAKRLALLLYIKQSKGMSEMQKTREMTKFLEREERSFMEIRKAALSREQKGLFDTLAEIYSHVPPLLRPVITSLCIGIVAGGTAVALGSALPAALGIGVLGAGAAAKRAAVSMLAGTTAAAALDFAFLMGQKIPGSAPRTDVRAEDVTAEEAVFAKLIDRRADEIFKEANRAERQDLQRRLVATIAGFGAAGLANTLYEPGAEVASLAPSAETPPEYTPAPNIYAGADGVQVVEYPVVVEGSGAIETFTKFLSSSPEIRADFANMLAGVGVDTSLDAAGQADQLARELGFLASDGSSPAIPQDATFAFRENEGVWILLPDGTNQPLIMPGTTEGEPWVVTPYTSS